MPHLVPHPKRLPKQILPTLPPHQSLTKVDEFEKKYGIPPKSINGRENRIPYSRVKKITQNAVNEIAETALGRKLAQGEKAADVVKAHVAKFPELEAKTKAYEGQIQTYQNFENIMVNDAERHLQMLSTLPAYKKFFAAVEQAFSRLEQQGPAQTTPAQEAVSDDMPQPDQTLSDGSKVYSMEGLKALLGWQAKQVEARVTKQVQTRYEPIERNWQIQQRIEQVRPIVEKQIADARTWEKFNENEDEIVKVLQANPQISLETAYHHVVDPKIKAGWDTERSKLVADRNKIREEVLAELKAAPKATSAPTAAGRTPTSVSTGPRSLESIIAEQIKTLKG
jgi:hypothetical protein